jgi:hypothetical protein
MVYFPMNTTKTERFIIAKHREPFANSLPLPTNICRQCKIISSNWRIKDGYVVCTRLGRTIYLQQVLKKLRYHVPTGQPLFEPIAMPNGKKPIQAERKLKYEDAIALVELIAETVNVKIKIL